MMEKKKTIAVAMIVKNEADQLGACLESVAHWVDEIVILDSGSHDGTEAIARQFTDKFYVNKEWPGFGPQRRLAQSHVVSDYILWLDADERVTPELKNSILSVLSHPQENRVYAVPRLSWAFGRYIRHSGWYPGYVARLYPCCLTQYDTALVHEKVEIPSGVTVERLKGDLLHFTFTSLGQYLAKSAMYAESWAKQGENEGKKGGVGLGILHAMGRFFKMYVLKAGFMDGRQGIVLAWLAANSVFAKYVELWVRASTSRQKSTD